MKDGPEDGHIQQQLVDLQRQVTELNEKVIELQDIVIDQSQTLRVSCRAIARGSKRAARRAKNVRE